MRCRYPWALKMVRFVENSLSSNQLNTSRADIPCVLENNAGEVARATPPVTLYITVNTTHPSQYDDPPSIPTRDYDSPAEEATIPGHIQFPVPEHLLPLSHPQPIETRNPIPGSREEISPTSINNPRLALHRADKAMEEIVPIDPSNTYEATVGRIKWVMDTLSPIAEVRALPF